MHHPEIEDDLTIEGSTKLYRRVDPRFIKIEGDSVRISGGAFQNTSGTDEMSVSLGDTLAEQGQQPDTLLDGFPGFGLVALTAEFVRSEEQRLRRSPTSEDPSHGNVIGRKTGARRKLFARRACRVFIPAQ